VATDAVLSILSRYEALFELSGEVNAATEIAAVGQVLARRLKFVADVFSWRYLCIEPEAGSGPASGAGPQAGAGPEAGAGALVVDGYRGEATVERLDPAELSPLERGLWAAGRARTVEDEELAEARASLPAHFQKADIVQLYAYPHFGAEGLEGLMLFSKRRQPLNDLDVKFVALAAQLFHDKMFLLWEQEKRRRLETAYLQQEIMLRQSEKLATLGRLSAGMAHEVNNPASAALRNAEQLAEELQQLEKALERLGQADLTPEQHAALTQLRTAAVEKARHPVVLEALACTEAECDVEAWLDDHAVGQGWQLAPALVSMGFDPAQLADQVQVFSAEQRPAILDAVTRVFTAHAMVEEIRTGAGRVTEIVNALRSYAYLDQAPVQEVDVHEGLNDTLVLLRTRLEGVTVHREFDHGLPRITAYGRELNQVWTNIIDNAAQALNGAGELKVVTYAEDETVVVEIWDSGPGIPPEIQERIFDPFFTTKPPGQGTGLGLNVSHNVVEKHGGSIQVRSQPGATCFRVRLPLELEVEPPA
jgi:signal transduction histidine kinase